MTEDEYMLLLWEKILSGTHKINAEENEEQDKNNGDYFGFEKMKKANEEKRKETERIDQTKVDIGTTILY